MIRYNSAQKKHVMELRERYVYTASMPYGHMSVEPLKLSMEGTLLRLKKYEDRLPHEWVEYETIVIPKGQLVDGFANATIASGIEVAISCENSLITITDAAPHSVEVNAPWPAPQVCDRCGQQVYMVGHQLALGHTPFNAAPVFEYVRGMAHLRWDGRPGGDGMQLGLIAMPWWRLNPVAIEMASTRQETAWYEPHVCPLQTKPTELNLDDIERYWALGD